ALRFLTNNVLYLTKKKKQGFCPVSSSGAEGVARFFFIILFSLPYHIRNRIHRFRHKADRLFIEHFPVF
ncbi:MAG: hypothetical protein ACLUI5_15240, partial [Fusicatenibacter saccharivorans]